jgi:hypothetical protein
MTPAGYYAYLLRLWRAQEDGKRWRIQPESVESGEKRSFANLEAMTTYLERLGEDQEEPGKEASDTSDTHAHALRSQELE